MSTRVEPARAAAEAFPREVHTLPPPPLHHLQGAGTLRFRIHHQPVRPFSWELRLEKQGLALSWAMPQGIPWGQGEARPANEGALLAAAPLWDEGSARMDAPDAWGAVVELDGRKVRGRYALRHEAGERWILQRLDPASLRPMPERVLPMLAHAASYPEDPKAYAFELKWDGIRALAHVRDGAVRLRSRSLADITPQYPELQGLGAALAGRQAILDGEIVAFDEEGRSSFQRLQGRLGVSSRHAAHARAEDAPVTYMLFDILYLDGQDLTSLSYEERRAALESLGLEGPRWRVSPARLGEGRALLATPGIEGIVAKRLGSHYEPGARSRAWRKIKLQRRQELVIAGWTPGRGVRRGRIGSLLVGHYDVPRAEADARGEPQRFLYAGSVGTGFSERTLEQLHSLLLPYRRDSSPFDQPIDKRDALFVEPRLVGEFEFTEWTRSGRLRHPSFKGLREDKDARDVVREE